MKKLLVSFIVLIFVSLSFVAYSAHFYGFTALTGGGTGALDKITGMSHGDLAIGVVSGVQYSYSFNSSSIEAESSPTRIKPNTGSGCWEISANYGTALDSEPCRSLLPNCIDLSCNWCCGTHCRKSCQVGTEWKHPC
jgi:hypothetical protein